MKRCDAQKIFKIENFISRNENYKYFIKLKSLRVTTIHRNRRDEDTTSIVSSPATIRL
jgi:hypothetical protein